MVLYCLSVTFLISVNKMLHRKTLKEEKIILFGDLTRRDSAYPGGAGMGAGAVHLEAMGRGTGGSCCPITADQESENTGKNQVEARRTVKPPHPKSLTFQSSPTRRVPQTQGLV